MPRNARERSESGLYHVMVRGINRQDIFMHPDDKLWYLEAIAKVKSRSKCQVYAYCLMNNHVHLLLGEGGEELGDTMKRLGSSYVRWFNTKYERVGHLFQDRFLSEPVEGEGYLLAAIRYIHQNPVKANIVKDCSEYVWSSYRAYALDRDHPKGLTDTALAMGIAGGRQQFLSFHQETSTYEFQDVELQNRARSEDVLAVFRSLQDNMPGPFAELQASDRDRVLRSLKAIPGASNRQIALLTGVNRKAVDRA